MINLPTTMHAMVLQQQGQPLVHQLLPLPVPSAEQVLINVSSCGVCRTDLHILDGDLDKPKLPLIPGHEIVGKVVQAGEKVINLKAGDVVGVPWLGFTCGQCRYCLRGKENLCEKALFTGYTIDGGYAEYTVAFANYCIPLPAGYDQPSVAPLLCAGLIGYRSYTKAGPDVEHLGIYGFGAAAHILLQVALFQKKKVYAFTRDNDTVSQKFARRLGATWAGGTSDSPPHLLDAAILFAPAGDLVPQALKHVEKGGVVVCGGIHMSDIPSFPYSLLWGERVLCSVANLTKKDGVDFFKLAPQIPLRPTVQWFPLQQANEALNALREGAIQGAAVLAMPHMNETS
ncbi:MAG TPA: zinc-dependent alcohol dehydrogenase family protein [Flavisolibacter sp.]|nr:zinc-dependent alcohol dehydrogenase family protein [Flavisolibacter sp.]